VAVFQWLGVRWIGRELTGVWRSVRYDLARRANPSRQPTEVLYPEYDAYQRQPRRWYAAVGLGAVVAGGVAAVYVVVAGGLGALLSPIASAVPGLGGAAPAVRSTGTGAPAAQQPVVPSGAGRSRAPVRHAPTSPAARRPAEVPAPNVASTPVPVPTPQSASPTPGHSPSPSSSPSVTPSPSPTPTGGTVEQP
jgi:hypothetical protein